MITRVEYQSNDGKRSATVLMIGERRWSVLRRIHKTGQRVPWVKPLQWAKSLTSAQGMARTWTR